MADATPSAAEAAAEAAPLSMFVESLTLEHQFLRVPLEHLKNTFRAHHRCVEKEVAAVLSDADLFSQHSITMSRQDAIDHLSSLASRLHDLKRKVEDGKREKDFQANRFLARLAHLESMDADDFVGWNNKRVKRILVDYMLRMSYYDTAKMFAEESEIEDLVDIDVFLDAKKVIDSLQNEDVGPALAWCKENKSRLKKSKSKLEFQLRLQEFVELVRAGNKSQAIQFAQMYLVPWRATCMKELQEAMAALAFSSNTETSVCKVLFDPMQWDNLVEQFKKEFFRLFGMTSQPLLNIYLQAGLAAMKTASCLEGGCTTEDPLSQEAFRKLAAPLPLLKQHRSKIFCYITGKEMDEENPPLVLPNGYVYSTEVLQEMANRNNGKVTCPRTGETYDFSELVDIYIP